MSADQQFDVIIIGGGATGTGVARDCALRGLKALLVERWDTATGATGRNHGLLHSGARYAVKDGESAAECISENRILRSIASNCIEDTGGIFITLPEDEESGYGADYRRLFIESCQKAGIDAVPLSPADALKLEPSANPSLTGAVRVPDGSVDPFRLCGANVTDAALHGATILTYTEVIGMLFDGKDIIGIKARDARSGSVTEYRAKVTVIAAGIWSQAVAAMAGVKLSMYPAKGALLVFGHRVNQVVINRCRKSADGDILVPGDTVSVIGTTSTRIPYDECDDMRVTRDEVQLLLREGTSLCPALASTRILRAYAGVRPLISDDSDPTGRSISRGIVCIDHASRDGVEGLVSIVGGKLMTYRLMAEMATDEVCRKLGRKVDCITAETPLPGSADGRINSVVKRFSGRVTPSMKGAAWRQGDLAGSIPFDKEGEREMVCECENVSVAEMRYAVNKLGARTLHDIRRRTRLGMGTCQGTLCIRRAAKVLAQILGEPDKAEEIQNEYLEERWKGMCATGWGDGLREMELMQKVYKHGKPFSYDEV